MWKLTFAIILVCLFAGQSLAAKPVVLKPFVVVKDGFPTGNDTPEGAACDLARAFIHDDAALFLATCIEPFGDVEAKAAYHRFLESVVVQMKMDPAKSGPAAESPRSIVKCFAARHLSKPGPASGAAAALGFQDVMYVDVTARLQNGETQLCRTLVIKNKLGKWMVEPQPEQWPSLSAGLDDESPSTQDFSEVYLAR